MRERLTERALAYARCLVQIESVTFRERPCAKALREILAGLDFQVDIDEDNNLVARLHGTQSGAPGLLFIGHHDTVEPGSPEEWDFPPLEAVVENGKLHGRGSNDEKGGLAAFLAAAEYMQARGLRPRGDLILVSTREEIGDLEQRGILQVLRRAGYSIGGGLRQPGRVPKKSGSFPEQAGSVPLQPEGSPRKTNVSSDLLQAVGKAGACICLEPTEATLMLGHRGRAVTDFTVTGRAAHASMPARGVNAVTKAAGLISALEVMPLPGGTSRDWVGTQAVTMIQGGTGENIVPEECCLTVDRRILEGENENTLTAEYGQVIQGLQEQDPELEVRFRVRPPYYAALTDREDGFVQALQDICRSMDLPEEPAVFPGHTDAEWVINDMGIPCVIFGPGSLSTAHTAREYVPVRELGICAEMYYRAMLAFGAGC